MKNTTRDTHDDRNYRAVALFHALFFSTIIALCAWGQWHEQRQNQHHRQTLESKTVAHLVQENASQDRATK